MNHTTRIGKIARLSHNLREHLNLKLHDGLPAKSILPWLNSLPEVKTILAADFDSRPITKQNLSEWKHGGFRDWLLQYHAAQFLQFIPSDSSSAESQDGTGQLQNPPNKYSQHATRTTNGLTHGTHDIQGTPLIARLLLWTQLQYTTMARHIDSETDPERKWTALRQFANDISRLRRSAIADDFLQIQRDWLALSQSNSTEKKELEFCKWIKRPDIADAIKNKRRGITSEEWRKIEEEDLYLLGPDDPSLDEHIAQVRLAKELMARRKAKEAEAKRQPGDPVPEAPEIKLRETSFEELFPTIPDKPLTQTHPELDDDPDTDVSNADSAPSPSTQRRAATSNESVGREGKAQPGLPTPPEETPSPANLPPDPSDPVQPSPTESNQIQPASPSNCETSSNNDNAIPDN